MGLRMKAYWVILLMLIMTACTAAKDERYYQAHPKELQKALENCPNQPPAHLSCSRLRSIAVQFNRLAGQLQANPQAFGKRILELQQQISRQKEQLRSDPEQGESLQAKLQEKQQELDERLIIVRLFESPGR